MDKIVDNFIKKGVDFVAWAIYNRNRETAKTATISYALGAPCRAVRPVSQEVQALTAHEQLNNVIKINPSSTSLGHAEVAMTVRWVKSTITSLALTLFISGCFSYVHFACTKLYPLAYRSVCEVLVSGMAPGLST